MVAAAALIGAVGSTPVTAWRIAKDVAYTSKLASAESNGAGPIQAFLQPICSTMWRACSHLKRRMRQLQGPACRTPLPDVPFRRSP